MAFTLKLLNAKQAANGVDLQLSVNGQPHSEGRVFQSLADAVQSVDDKPMDVDDLLWLVRRCARAQGLTLAQIKARTLTVDFTSPNVVTFS